MRFLLRSITYLTNLTGIFLCSLLIFLMPQATASVAPTAIKRLNGIVVDAETGEGLPFANLISTKNKKENAVANENGAFLISTYGDGKGWIVSVAGYDTAELEFDGADTTKIIRLVPSQQLLEELVVKPSKEKYSKKNNPAVDFVRRLRKDSESMHPEREPFFSYDKYEKTIIGVNEFNNDFSKGFLSKSGKFLSNYVDKSPVTGKKILNMMLKEKVSTDLYHDNGSKKKEVTRGYQSFGIDEVINQDNMRIILEDAVREIDVFGDNIVLLQNRFVSPLSSIGPDFYKYYLTDTLYVGSDKCFELSFAPHNPQSMGFNGKIYVPVNDSVLSIKKITMRSPKDINLNLVDNIFINLSFERDSIGKIRKTYDDVCLELSLLGMGPKLYGRKTTAYSNFSYEKKEELKNFYDKIGRYFTIEEADSRTSLFWSDNRDIPLSAAELKMQGMMGEMRKNKLFYWGEKAIRLLESGYVLTGKPSKIDLGPINTLISGNSVEGVRFRAGGMTTAYLNPNLFASGYVAYGTRDRKFKYDIELAYSFSRKKYHSYEWPRHGLYASYKYDVDMLGQHYLFTNSDNVFLSFKRKESILATYRRLAEVGYILELPNNFSIETTLKRETQEGTKWINFKFIDGVEMKSYSQASVVMSLRWAPGERFIQGRTTRSPVNMDAWIFQLTQEYGSKGIFGSAFTVNKTELSLQKRLWLSAFGYMNLIVKGGKVWSSVYFPSLMWPNANLSYTIQPESYSLMNPMEFANDKYASLDFSYYGLGVLFNRLPWIKKLKLREVVTFKGLIGGLSEKNNPIYNHSLPLFPTNVTPTVMHGKPYMEAGIGIENIFRVLRVDYVWRLTYRDVPGRDRSGLRVSLHFSF